MHGFYWGMAVLSVQFQCLWCENFLFLLFNYMALVFAAGIWDNQALGCNILSCYKNNHVQMQVTLQHFTIFSLHIAKYNLKAMESLTRSQRRVSLWAASFYKSAMSCLWEELVYIKGGYEQVKVELILSITWAFSSWLAAGVTSCINTPFHHSDTQAIHQQRGRILWPLLQSLSIYMALSPLWLHLSFNPFFTLHSPRKKLTEGPCLHGPRWLNINKHV